MLVSVSSDQYMPSATITEFDESVKYKPMDGAFRGNLLRGDVARSC